MKKTPHLRTLQLLAGFAAGGFLVLNQAQAQLDYATPYAFITIAGTYGNYNTNNGTGAAAAFESPNGVAVDTNDNLYVVDDNANTVRKVSPSGTNWVVTTIAGSPNNAGSGDGMNQAAQFDEPDGIALDPSNNLYVADTGNEAIRKVTKSGANWNVTTIAGTAGPGNGGSADGTNGSAQFTAPQGIAADAAGNIYVADTGNNTIRKITPMGTNWVTTTIAGTAGVGNAGYADGTNGAATFSTPSAIAVDASGNLFVADTDYSIIREIVHLGTNWITTTIAGTADSVGPVDGTNGGAEFFGPTGIAVDASDNLYVADSQQSLIRKISLVGTNWVTTTLAGTPNASPSGDGTGPNALFGFPQGIAVDISGRLFVADSGDNDLRMGTIAGVGNLTISLIGQNNVLISWPGFGVLQTNDDLTSPNWGNYGGAVAATNGINSVTFAPPLVGNLFFRLTN